MKKNFLIKYTTKKSVKQTVENLLEAVVANNFGVMHIHNLKETMAKKGVDFKHECIIVEVCNPHQAKKVLDSNMNLSAALPCRISVYEENGETHLVTLKPTDVFTMLNPNELDNTACEVEKTLTNIMLDAIVE